MHNWVQGWEPEPLPALAGSSWANMAAGSAQGADAGATPAKQGVAGKRPSKPRKGGLSMFLSGGLEKPDAAVAAKLAAAAGDAGAPWRLAGGGLSAPTSLRAIQRQEAAAGTRASVTLLP